MLDLQTLTFSSVLAALISSAFFIFAWFINKKVVGINLWLAAMMMQPSGWLLLSLRGHISVHLSILVANILLILSMLLFLLGWRTFLKLKCESTKSVVIFLCVFCPIFAYFIYISPNITVRILLIHCTSAVFMISCLYSFFSLSKKQRTVGGLLFCAICTLILLFNLFRALTALFFDQTIGLFDISLTNFLNPLFGFLIPYGLTLSIFILCNEKQLLEVKTLENKAKLDAQTKQRYLAILSHELRTPLNGMIGKAQLMRPQLESEQLKKDCDVIIDSGHALSQLTNEVLEFTLLEQENLILVNTELTTYLNNIIELLKPLAIQKNIKLTLTANTNVNVLIEANKIRQVLINLLGNAIKFTHQGEVNLTINIEKHLKNKAILTFIITDTGVGISQENSTLTPSMITPNSQEEIHEYNNQKGYGLGLSLCEQLLKTMGSHLDFTSTENKGSTFYFSINTQVSPLTQAAKTLLSDEIETTDYVQSLNVLLVEDIKLNQDIAKTMLEKDHHQVSIANTGGEAIAMANAQIFDLIFLDMQLPDLHGLEVLKNMRQLPSLNINTSVIALTATITAYDLNLYEQANIFDLIEKPILLPKLREIISRCNKLKEEQKKIFSPIHNTNEITAIPLFNVEVLAFLLENLSTEQFKQTIQEAPKNLTLYADNTRHSSNFKTQAEWLHKLAGYSAQLGLTRLSKQAILLEKKVRQQKSTMAINLTIEVEQSSTALNLFYANRYS
tara:strand:- start:1116 stop:3308 length:2193 start_codon:yes stop_codon:yes gene_type:complete